MKRLYSLLLLLVCCHVLNVKELSAQFAVPAWRYVGLDGGNVSHIVGSGDTLYAAAEGGRFFRSVDGTTWQEITSLGAVSTILGLASNNGRVFAVFPIPTDFPSLYSFSSSTTGGVSWESFHAILPMNSRRLSARPIIGIAGFPDKVIVAASEGIINLTTASVPFTQVIRNPEVLVVSTTLTCIANRQNLIFSGTQDSLLHTSFDSGKTWVVRKPGFTSVAIACANDSLVFAASTQAIFRSLDLGISWQSAFTLPATMTIRSLAFSRGMLYAATTLGIMRSRNIGKDWEFVNTGLSLMRITDVIANDSAVFVYNLSALSYLKLRNERLDTILLPNNLPPNFIGVTQSAFWASSADSSLWRSVNGVSWSYIGNLPGGANKALAIGYAGFDRNIILNVGANTWYSDNVGRSWVKSGFSGTFFADQYRSCFATINDTVWFAKGGFMRSVDRGKTFTRLRFALNPGNNQSFYIEYLSSFNNIVYASGTYNNSLLGAFEDGGIFMLPLSQLQFDSTGTAPVKDFESGRYICSRKGELLRGYRYPPGPSIVQYLPINGSWRGFPPVPNATATMTALAANSTNVFIGTNSGLFILNAVTTSVPEEPTARRQTDTDLLSIAPNPASDGVSFRFTLAKPVSVRLSLFDVLGREVMRLAEEENAFGEKQYNASLNGLPQGIYAARLSVGGRFITKTLRIVH